MTQIAASLSLFPAKSRSFRHSVSAIAGLLAIAVLAGCTTEQQVRQAPPPPPPAKTQAAPMAMTGEKPGYLHLPGMPAGQTPVRVGIILPFSNGSPATRHLAASMMNAAEMALYDSGNRNIILMTGDEGGGGAEAAEAARNLFAKGAEVILGPLFAASVKAVAPVAKAHGVPVIAFSTDRSVAGHGVYLLSFQPENEIRQVVSYAASQGHASFAALVPRDAYGDHVAAAFAKDVPAAGGHVADIERYDPQGSDIAAAAKTVATTHPDTLLVAQGGPMLKSIAPALSVNGLANGRVQLLGSGLWDDRAIIGDTELVGGWFAAPRPEGDTAFAARYQQTFGERPQQLTTLSYDAVALAALLANGAPYHRFTDETLTDPNGFSGITGIFRFDADGDCERGLAILSVGMDGFQVMAPAPKTFQKQGS